MQFFKYAILILVLSLGSPPYQVAAEDPSVDMVAERYVKLILAIGEHEPGYVDAYYGPPKWQGAIKANVPSLENLAAEASSLTAILTKYIEQNSPSLDRQRLRFLDKQLTAADARISMLQGNKFSFDEETALLFDAVVPPVHQVDLDASLRALDDLIGGEGSLQERFIAYRKQFTIPKNKLASVFAAAIEGCKTQTNKFMTLPKGENFTTEFVTDKPWSGYNWYQGGAVSLIQVNTDLPSLIDAAVNLGCHEGYPGHHVFNAMLENNLVDAKGWVEFSVYPLYSPQSFLAEGTASFARFMAFPEGKQTEFETSVLYPLAGIDPGPNGKSAKQYADTLQALAGLKYARIEGARRYLDGKINRDELIDWLSRYQLISRERAAQGVRFIETYRGYVINYTLGSDLAAAYVARKGGTNPIERWRAYITLLSTPLTASMLGD